MEPDIEALSEALSQANEIMSQAFVKQSLAFNNLQNALRELREGHPTLFNQKDI